MSLKAKVMRNLALQAIESGDMHLAYVFANEYADLTCASWDAVKEELGLS